MPIDYKKYPVNWKSEIRPDILKRANDCCEHEGCGVKNYSVGYRNIEGKFIECHDWYYEQSKVTPDGFKMIKIILTIAHLDNDIRNNDYSNLKALCQYHHLRMDVKYHKENSRKTNNKKKLLQELF